MNTIRAFLIRVFVSSVTCQILILGGCAKSPDSPERTLARAKLMMERGEGAEAIPLLTKVLAAMPQNSELYFERGLVYENLNLPEKALADYVSCLRLDNRHIDALNSKAVQLAKLKRYDEAINVFTELVDLDREDFLGYRNRALCRFDMHDNPGALEDYGTALKLNPNDPSSWFQRGKVHLSMENPVAAESDFSKSLELDSGFAMAWMNRGVAKYRTGERASAAEDLQKAQELDANIVLPAIDFFGDSRPSAAASEVKKSAVWNNCRPLIEAELADRGFTELVFVQDFPDLQCAELTALFHGQQRTVLVTCQENGNSTVTLPCTDFLQGASGEQRACTLLVLQIPDENNTAPTVARFELQPM